MSKRANSKPLIPPDYKRCQAEVLPGSFMTLGPRVWKRCHNQPTVIVEESSPGEDGKIGSMSLCEDCLKVFKLKYPKIPVNIKKI